MSSCDTYGTQCIDTGSQLTADSVAFNDELIESGCASVQCVLDNLVIGTREHVSDEDNPHKVNIDQIPHALNDHSDASFPTPLDGQVITYVAASGAFEALTSPVGVTDHLLLTNIGTNNHEIIDQHLANLANPHQVTAAQTGAEPENANIQAHIADVATNPHAVSHGSLTGTAPTNYNIIINGDSRINQRGFDGNWAGLSDGDYGFDRWYRVNATHLAQVVEGASMPWIDNNITLSWEGGGDGKIFAGTVAEASGPSPLTGDSTGTPAVDNKIFEVPNDAYGVKLQQGVIATPYEARTIQQELAMCQRYYYRIEEILSAGSGAATATDTAIATFTMPSDLARTPDVSISALGDFRIQGNGSNLVPTNYGIESGSPGRVSVRFNAVGIVSRHVYACTITSAGHIEFNAEL